MIVDIQHCPICGCHVSSATHKKQREKCSAEKKRRYDASLTTAAYLNEQAALKEAKKKEAKNREMPFSQIRNKRGVVSKVNFL